MSSRSDSLPVRRDAPSEVARAIEDLPTSYSDVLREIKIFIDDAHVRMAQVARAANAELLMLYWQIGRLILERQAEQGWGTRVIDRLSADLRVAFPSLKGMSTRSLQYMRTFANGFPEAIAQQLVAQLPPWGHVVAVLDRVDDRDTRLFYLNRAADEGWSRATLIDRIASRLHERQGAALSTFDRVVPDDEREVVRRVFQDPYVLDFIDAADISRERELEEALVTNLTAFLQHLGSGFAYLGRQTNLQVGGEQFFTDLLFYHTRLHRYVVFELKLGAFVPEHIGKLNFYIQAIDAQLRDVDRDSPTVGILLVAERNDVVVQYTLTGVQTPMAVSRYTYANLPDDVRTALPSAEELASTVEQTVHYVKHADQASDVTAGGQHL